ncbi:unnamed protein product, partial [Medioppia subpectinata]
MGFAIFVCLVYIFSLTPILSAQVLTDGDCLGYASFDYFRQSPGGYDSADRMDGQLCAALCAKVWMPYAGVVKHQHCLCAYEHDRPNIEAIDKVSAELCDRSDEYVRYYEGKVMHPIVALAIKGSAEEAAVDQEVSFEVSVGSGEEVEYSVDFGDGTDPTDWSPTMTHQHRYFMPGQYMVVVFARQPEHLNRRVLSEITYIHVTSELVTENIHFKCPKVVEPGDPALCNLTVNAGQRMEMTVDFGDGSPAVPIPLPDVPMRSLGVNIPQYKTPTVLFGSALKPEELLIIPLPEKELDSSAAIQALEGYGAAPGNMQLFILRKVCPEGLAECNEGHGITCFEPSALCVLNKGCSDNCQPFPPKKTSYSIVKTFTLTITEGHFYLQSTSSFRMLAGDVLAIRSDGAQLAHRAPKKGETPDYITDHSADGVTAFSSDAFREVKQMKHLIRAIVSEPLALTVPHEYEESGRYGIRLALKNRWTAAAITRESSINIQSTISKMRLTVMPPDTPVDQRVDITIQLNKGSNIKVLWDFGDGNTVTDQIPVIKSSQRFMKTYKYSQPGVYTIRVKAENLQGETSTEHTLIAEHPVHKNWKIVSNSPQLLPGFVDFNFTYPMDKIMPTNASTIIDFGDGKREVWDVPDTDWTGLHVIQHEYEKAGKYNVKVNMSNIVSKQIRRFQVDVLRRITGLKVTAKYHNPDRGFIPGIGPNTDYFPIDRQINFTFATQTGDIEHYVIDLNGHPLQNSTDNVTSFVTQEPGFYNFTFYGYNNIQKKSKSYSLPMYILEPIEGLDIYDMSNDTVEPEIKRFAIEFAKMGTNSCLIVDYGQNKAEIEAFGDSRNCRYLYPDVKYTLMGNLTNPLDISKQYDKPKDYRLKFSVSNQISTISREVTVTVIEIDCKPPILNIRNRVVNWRRGLEFWKSKPIQLFSKTIVDCNATTAVTRVWDAYRLEEENGTVTEQVDLSSLDSYRKSFLYVPPFFLPDGYYMFRYSINMTSPEPHPLLPFYAHSYTYVKVVRSPISAQLAEGAQSRVIRGWGQRIRFAPEEFSVDPDDATNKNFEVRWFCRRIPDEYIDNRLPDERQNFSEPLYDRTGIDEEWDDDDGGGCFGRGPGLDIYDMSNDTVEPEIKRFAIEFAKMGTNSCLIVDYGQNKAEIEAFGDSRNCRYLYPDVKYTLMGNLTNPLDISKQYDKPKDYRLKFSVSNQISTISREVTVTVIEIDCKPPILNIRNRVVNWRRGLEFWKSKPIQLFSKTIVDCNATTAVTRVWDAYRLEEENGTVTEQIDLSLLDSYRKSFLYVPPFFLPDGYYMFRYSINMTSPEPHPLLPFYAHSYTYVKVVRSPISAQLAEGAQSRVIRGWGQRIRFAPEEFSVDPDDATNKNFEVRWFCRRIPDEYIDNRLPDERQNFSEPLYDRTGIDEEWDDDDGGGCFGRGP